MKQKETTNFFGEMTEQWQSSHLQSCEKMTAVRYVLSDCIFTGGSQCEYAQSKGSSSNMAAESSFCWKTDRKILRRKELLL